MRDVFTRTSLIVLCYGLFLYSKVVKCFPLTITGGSEKNKLIRRKRILLYMEEKNKMKFTKIREEFNKHAKKQNEKILQRQITQIYRP